MKLFFVAMVGCLTLALLFGLLIWWWTGVCGLSPEWRGALTGLSGAGALVAIAISAMEDA